MINKKIILLIGAIVFCIVTLFLFFGKQDIIYEKDNDIYTQTGIPYSSLTYNGTELIDHRYIISEELCVAENLGMNISIYPCNTRIFIGEDIENYVNFHWQGEVEQDTSWVFVYEGTLERGEITLGHDEIEEYYANEYIETWFGDYLVNEVINYVDISPPTIEDCELGTENNTFMYHVTQENETASYETNYCFSEVTSINDTAFYISGNASLSTQVLKNRTITIYDIPIEIEYIGQNLLGDEFNYYRVLDVIFEPDQIYKTKWSFTPSDHSLSGKWHIFGFNSEYSLEESLDLGQYIYIDPTWTINFDDGLVAYWKMDDLTLNGTDEVFGDNNFTTFAGFTTRGANGLINQSYRFNGTTGDFADVTNIQSMNSTTGTVSFWFNWSGFQSTGNYKFLQGFWDIGLENTFLYTVLDNGSAQTLRVQGSDAGLSWTVQYNLTKIEQGKWVHLVYTQNGTGVSLYLNGTKVDSSTGIGQSVWLNNITHIVDTMRIGEYSVTGYPFNGTIDEMAYWNRSLTDAEISDLYNDGDGRGYRVGEYVSVHLDYPTNNSETASSIINFTVTLEPIRINNTNATLYLWNATALISSNITNNITGVVANQTNFSIENLNFGNYTWNIWGCGNSSNNTNYCDFAFSNYSFKILNFVVTNSYAPTHSYETEVEIFHVNVSLSDGLTITDADLIWNGTNKGGSSTLISGQNYKISQTFDIPTGTNGSQIGSYWNIILSDGGVKTTDVSNMSVDLINLSICGVAPQNTIYLNFSIQEEGTLTIMNASIENVWKYWLGTGSENKSFLYSDLNDNLTNFVFCLNPSDETLKIGGITEYYSAGYDHRTHLFPNDSFTNITTNITFYLLATAASDIVTFTVVDDFSNPLSSATIEIYRWNLVTDTYYLVNTITTGASGTAGSNLVLNDPYYMFLVYYNGNLELTTSPEKVISITKILQIFISGFSDIYTVFDAMTHSLIFNNVTNLFTFEYSDLSNSIDGACLNVQKIEGFGSTTLVRNCSTLTLDTRTFDISIYGNGTYLATGVASDSVGIQTIYKLLDSLTITLGLDERFSIIGRAGYVISMVFIGTMAMIGVATGSIPFGLVLIGVSFIVLNLLGFANFTQTFISAIICIIILTALSLQRRSN